MRGGGGGVRHQRAIDLLNIAAHAAASNCANQTSFGTETSAAEQKEIETELMHSIRVLRADADRICACKKIAPDRRDSAPRAHPPVADKVEQPTKGTEK